MTKSSMSAILANLGSKLSSIRAKESIKKISTGKLTAGGNDAGLQSLSNTLKARSDSWKAAAKNARDAIDALEVAEASLNEIASLASRLQEIGSLYNNNDLLPGIVIKYPPIRKDKAEYSLLA